MPTLNIWELAFMLFTKRVTNCALDVKFISTKDQWSNIMIKIIIFYAVHFSSWFIFLHDKLKFDSTLMILLFT